MLHDTDNGGHSWFVCLYVFDVNDDTGFETELDSDKKASFFITKVLF